MRVTIVQALLAWEQQSVNRQHFTERLAPLKGQTDLVVLPEMFSTGFSMRATALAEPMDGPTVSWMVEQAATLGAAVTGSFICQLTSGYTNRLVWAYPDGRLRWYDKRHLFGMAGEQDHYISGQERVVLEWQGWRVCPLICYDLRFPVWSRNDKNAPFDLLIYIANWPSCRAHHWRSLLMARAIENQCFVAGVNIVGQDGQGLEYSGDSAVIDFAGHPICQISGQAGAFTANLSLPDLQQHRQQLPFLRDADSFTLQ